MKKFICLIFVCIELLLCSGCQYQGPEFFGHDDTDYEYRDLYQGDNDYLLASFDIKEVSLDNQVVIDHYDFIESSLSYASVSASNAIADAAIVDLNNTTSKKAKAKKAIASTNGKYHKGKSLGIFHCTAYCACQGCCGLNACGITASGAPVQANHTIAVDTSVIPFGTKVVINNTVYTAEDTGSAIQNDRIDIYFDSHQAALQFGVQDLEVFLYK